MEWLEKELQNVFAKDASKRFGGWVVRMKGLNITFKAHEEMGKRVQTAAIGGKPIELDKEYTIAACERDGDPQNMLCRIPNVKNVKDMPFTTHQVVKEYIEKNTPLTPTPQGNVKILDAPQTLLSQVFGVDYQFV
jgi:hypothetical protein